MESQKESIDYAGYLKLDQILNAQFPKSADYGKPAHDEMLFIIIHQAYELWFKQIIYELDSIILMFQEHEVDEKKLGIAVSRLDRIREIQKILIDQIRILETMTPLDFLDYRDYLVPASGFQSGQFRLLEKKLGLDIPQRIKYNNRDYHESLTDKEKSIALEAEKQDTLFDLVNQWLERTPFLNFEGFDFLKEYKAAVTKMLNNEKQTILTNTIIPEEDKPRRIQMIEATEEYFQSIFDKKKHDALVEKGDRKLSYQATLAALFINLYRDQPILHLPYRMLAALLDIDELFTTWRYRHSLMVLRMIGKKVGTGGSSGHDYLKNTAEKHKIFEDLFNLSTLLIPRSDLPDLPKHIEQKLAFHYTVEHGNYTGK